MTGMQRELWKGRPSVASETALDPAVAMENLCDNADLMRITAAAMASALQQDLTGIPEFGVVAFYSCANIECYSDWTEEHVVAQLPV